MPAKRPVWLILGLLGLLSFAVGIAFDLQCPGGCVVQSVKAGVEKSGGSINIKVGDFHVLKRTDNDTIALISSDDEDDNEGEGEPVDVSLPDFAGIREVKIVSTRTDWTIKHAASGLPARLTFDGNTHAGKWTVVASNGILQIATQSKGPEGAVLQLPESFHGDISLESVSGELVFEPSLLVDSLKVKTVSGDVSLGAWPRQNLDISSVSGNVQNPEDAKGSSKSIKLSSISGDFELRVLEAFVNFSVETVSGSLQLNLPKDLDFDYSLNTVNGDFEGLPEGGSLEKSPGRMIMKGKVGDNPKSSLRFQSISGDLHIEGAQLGASIPFPMLAFHV